MPLCSVYEDRDGREDIADSELTAGEDRAGRKRELSMAGRAFENFARGNVINPNSSYPQSDPRRSGEVRAMMLPED